MVTSPQTQPRPSRARRRRVRWVAYTSLALVLLLVAALAGSYVYARRSLPQVGGELQLTGLTAPVTVYRDEWGVPHIEAQSAHDLYMAQGYVTAQDRLWQMDLSRRAASGRLAEIFGEAAVETDKYFRTLMLRRAAEWSLEAYSPETVAILEAYAAGVNAYIKQAVREGRLPVEFTILGYEPDPWTPVDTLAIGKYMAYDLSNSFPKEIYRYQLRQKVGDELALELFPVYPVDGITIMKYRGAFATPQHETAAANRERMLAELPPAGNPIDVSDLWAAAVLPDEFVGSNNWVVSGALTKSGKPLLANDPHLGVGIPSIWYQTHLVLSGDGEQMNVIGVTFPGSPGIVIGHNERIAWGVTNTGPDVQDLYIEKRNPDNPYQFEYRGEWEDATVYKERIPVKGGDPVEFEVVVTRHGPIISEIAGSEENRPEEALALKWTAHLPTTEVEAFLRVNRAANWEEFREALRGFHVPTQNFVFASVDGTIAYHAGGLVPIRARGDGLVPVPGWTGEYEWTGWIPFDEMPEVVNPPEGFIVTANNKVVDDAYPYHLTYSWAQPHRATRITEVLQGGQGFTVEEMRRLQTDYTNLQARKLLPILLPHLEEADLTETEAAALALLQEWNQVDAADQGAPLVYHLWWSHLTYRMYAPLMGDDLYDRMKDQGNVTEHLLMRAAHGDESEWIRQAGGLSRLVVDSFKAAVAEVTDRQGSNPRQWQWGNYHRLGPQHPLGAAVAPLGWFLNTEPMPVGGSNITVGAMSFDRETGLVTSSAPWRQVVDLADIAGNSYDIVTPGQAGHFLSRWYDSQQAMHVRGELHPQLFTPKAYRGGQKLVLTP